MVLVKTKIGDKHMESILLNIAFFIGGALFGKTTWDYLGKPAWDWLLTKMPWNKK